jgi:anti-anti-sigma regulatory factor
MLKVTTQAGVDMTVLLFEGKLTSPWTVEAHCYWREMLRSHRQQILIDLTDVTFIDSDGKALLAQMWRQGATFRAAGCLNTAIVEEITEMNRDHSSRRTTHT